MISEEDYKLKKLCNLLSEMNLLLFDFVNAYREYEKSNSKEVERVELNVRQSKIRTLRRIS